jgi:polyhydroxyalkanoate synthesis regulator phasin
MLEEIRKGLKTGLGAVVLSKEKIEEIGRKLVDEAKLNREDANKLMKELFSAGERQWNEMEQSLSEAVKKAVKKLDIGNKSEFQDIREKIDNLEKRISAIEESSEEKRTGP